MAYSPDGTRIVSCSFDGSLKTWDAATGTELATLIEPGQVQVCAVAYSPDGTRIVSDASRRSSGSGDPPALRIWDAATGSLLATFRRPTTKAVWAVDYSPDGSRIVCGGAGNSFGDDGILTVWDAATGAELHTVTGHTSAVKAVTFSPDGARLVTASFDGSVKVWEARTLDCIAVVPLGAAVQSCRHSPSGNGLCCGDSGKAVHILELLGSARSKSDRSLSEEPHPDVAEPGPTRQQSEQHQARRDVSQQTPPPTPKKPWYRRRSS